MMSDLGKLCVERYTRLRGRVMCVGVRKATLRRHWDRDLKEEETHKIRGTSFPSGGNSPRAKAL